MKNHCLQEIASNDRLVQEASLARLETDVLLHVAKRVLRKQTHLSFKCSANHPNCTGCYKSIESRILSKFNAA